MSFRNSFFGDTLLSSGPLQVSYGENVLINTADRGLTEISERMKDTNQYLQSVHSALVESQEHYRESAEESAQLLAAEIAWQTEQIMSGMAELSTDIREASSDITRAIGYLGTYLGAQISEVRWAIERNTTFTQKLLEVQLNSHWNDSRQYYEEGVQCYDSFEPEFARERFEEAVRVCKTNAFAYQYLGFLAVHRDSETEAKRNFELAAKFAPSDYHRAIAFYHLSRALYASGDKQGALKHIQTAVNLESENLVYLFELVHALIRAGDEDEAIQQLRKLISADMIYWTVSDIDRSLDPIRSKVNDLRNRMRKETGRAAELAMNLFAEVIHLTVGFDDSDLAAPISSAQETFKNLEALCQHGTIFDYQESEKAAPSAVEKMIQEVTNIYRNRMSYLRDRISSREATQAEELQDHKRRLSEIERLLIEISRRAELRTSETRNKEHVVKQAFTAKNETNLLSAGCLGCLSLVGIFCVSGILGMQSRPANFGEWFLVTAASAVSILLALSLPGWLFRKWRGNREFENTVAENREEGRQAGFEIAGEATGIKRQEQEFEKASREREEVTREEIRAMKDDLVCISHRRIVDLGDSQGEK